MTERNETQTEQMGDDIVKRLRRAVLASSDDAREAADLIDALRSTVATLTAERDEKAAAIDAVYAKAVALQNDIAEFIAAKDAQIATLTEQLREARERADTFDAACVKALDARDAALAEAARLREENDALRECVSDSGGNFEAWKAWHSPDPPKGE